MAGRGRPPKPRSERVNSAVASRGEIRHAVAAGWQCGDVPVPPEGLMPATVEAWAVWFAAWFAAFWSPSDLPGLRLIARLYDQVERGEFQRSSELRLQMDTYGITPKGQQDRRWQPPKKEQVQSVDGGVLASSRYGHLSKVV